MMRLTSVQKCVSCCGIMLGLLLMCHIAPPVVAEGSDAVAGQTWYPVYEGQNCYSNARLWCSNGAPGYGITGCSGNQFDGVIVTPTTAKTVHLTTNANCHSVTALGINCNYVRNSYCY